MGTHGRGDAEAPVRECDLHRFRARLSRDVTRVAIVGGGVIGTMHALEAVRRGYEVVQFERDPEPRKASVRNFGLIWVSGRAPGRELDLALRARERWGDISTDVPGIGFRPDGSLTVVNTLREADVLHELCAGEDAEARGVRLLSERETRDRNPCVRGDVVAAMVCDNDAIVEPRKVLPAIRNFLSSSNAYTFLASRTVLETETGRVRDHTGERFEVDAVIVCPGADLTTLPCFDGAPIRRCRLQMMETLPFGDRIPTAIADADSLRYYPAFKSGALGPAGDLVGKWGMQLLLAQRDDGRLTIGDTHSYDEPFDFWVESPPYEHLARRAESILGTALPAIERLWSGVYTARTDDEDVWYHGEVDRGVVCVTGLAGRGMTLSPVVAEVTLDRIGL